MKAISRVNTVVTDLGSEVVFWFDVAHAHGHSTLMFPASQILRQYWYSTWLITLTSRWTRDRHQLSASGRTTGITWDSGDNV